MYAIRSYYADYLNRESTSGVVTSEVIWTNSNAINALLVNLYSSGLKLDEFDDWYGGKSNLTNQTSLSDEATAAYQKESAFSNSSVTYTYGGNVFNDNLDIRYKSIRNINDFLLKVEETDILSNDEKSALNAEARFIRAMGYFSLVKRYGGVPLLTEPQAYVAGDVEALYIERSKEVDVYDFIINECKEIADKLPETRSGAGKYRATRGAAWALCSRAALYAATIAKYSGTLTLSGEAVSKGYVYIAASEAPRFFLESYNASKKILEMADRGIYQLYKTSSTNPEDLAANFYNLFSKTVNGDNGEYIFQKHYDAAAGYGHMWDKLNTPFSYRGDGWGCGMTPVLEMVEEFEYIDGSSGALKINDSNGNPISYDNPYDIFKDKDPRLIGSVYVPGGACRGTNIEWMRGVIDGQNGIGTKYTASAQPDQENSVTINGVKYRTSGKDGGANTGDASKTGFYQKKFLDETLTDMTNIDAKRSETPWVAFRLGEVYLNLAEACMEMGGKDDEALKAVNEIRARAGISLLTSITLEKVRHERKVELAFERLRYWDLKRWRVAHLDFKTNGIGLTNFRGTALYPWYNIRSGKYTFTTGIPPKQLRVFLERNYYTQFRPEDLSTDPKLVQNPGYGN